MDRSGDLEQWAALLREIAPKVRKVYAYANNHYAGFAPDTLRSFNRIWGGGLIPDVAGASTTDQPALF